jgi:predicted TIM-barrel fold metal-dependent hydrolase
MSVIVDADTHIGESPSMWELFDKDMYSRRPVLCTIPNDTLYDKWNAFWLIDGNIFPKAAGKGSFLLITPSESERQWNRKDISVACREITDPVARLREMDKQGVATQVIYPTLFLIYITDDPALDVAMARAYNRFLGRVWAQSDNRMRWAVIPPLRSMDDAIAELRYGKEHGAVGVFLRGVERDKTLDDPYFYPVYEEASRLNMPLCIHTGAGCPTWTSIFDVTRNGTFPHVRMLPLISFRDLIANRIPERFPDLRFGIIEAGASWVPYVFHNIRRSFPNDERHWGPDLFEKYRIYVACETDEDIAYLARFVGEDQLLIGSDYGHNDASEERDLVRRMQAREDLSDRAIEKILGENAQRFYAL